MAERRGRTRPPSSACRARSPPPPPTRAPSSPPPPTPRGELEVLRHVGRGAVEDVEAEREHGGHDRDRAEEVLLPGEHARGTRGGGRCRRGTGVPARGGAGGGQG